MLGCLDRQFDARISGERLSTVAPRVLQRLILKGILVAAPNGTTVPRCVCEQRQPDCEVRVIRRAGEYVGRCGVYGVEVGVTEEQVRWYRFRWAPWAAQLRAKNRLDGPAPALGTGCLFLGNGCIGGREFGLIVVAPGCHRVGHVVLPEGVRQTDRALIALLLGGPIEGLPVNASIPADALGDDLLSIDEVALEHALGPVPVTVTRGEVVYTVYARTSPRGARIDEAEYDRLTAPDVRDQYDLFIDRPACAVWRKGRRHARLLNAAGEAKGKGLGPTMVGLLADYVKRPGAAMTPKETPTYRMSSVSADSAAAQLSELRRSVRAEKFIVAGARSEKYGPLPYVFEPGHMTWCLIDRLSRPRTPAPRGAGR